jgi:iron complex outermembrane receptor protein
MSAIKTGFLTLVGVFLLVASIAFAEAAPGTDEPGDEMILFQNIPSVFGASKYEQRITEAPSSVSIVTAAEIKKYGYRSLADILRSLRSFYLTNDRNYEYVGVRGFNRPGDYNSRILVLVDGHRINENIYDSFLAGKGFILDVDLIDRMEVIRGPSSSLYGTGAFFAVINIITQRGRDLQGLEASGEAGSHDAYDGRLSYGKRLPGGFELLLSGTAGKSEGQDWFYPEFDDPATNNGTAEGRDWQRYGSAFLKASLADFTLSGAYSRRKKAIPTAPWETVFNHPDTWTLDESGYLDLQYERNLAEEWKILARVFYDYYWYEGEYPYDWAEEGDPPDILVSKDEAEGAWWGTELQFSRKLDRHRFIVGAEYRENGRQDQRFFNDKSDSSSNVLDSREDSDYWAAYLQDEFQISERLLLNVGVRHDNYSTFGGTTNPRLALILNPVEGSTVKLLYGEAFRAPNAYELYYHDGGLTALANPDLNPEEIATYELVVEQALGSSVRGVAAGFYYEIDNLIDQVEDADGLFVYRNLEEVEAWGMEFELEGRWESGLEGRLSYTFQETENQTTGRTLSNSPRHLAKFNLIVPLWRDRLFAGIEEQYTGRRKTLSRAETDDSAVTNLTLFSGNLVPGLEVSGSVYNLFDKAFSDPGSREHLQDAIEQDGRNYRLKLTYAF